MQLWNMCCVHSFTHAKVQNPTNYRMPPFRFVHIVQLHYNVDALTRNLMLQWLILVALDVATQPNLHIIEFYVTVQEEKDFLSSFFCITF